jgi:hypothetical protein
MLVAQISRGLSPVESILSASAAARARGLDYQPIIGMKLLDAKNRAVELALASQAGLILVEDDVVADDAIWDAACELSDGQVGYANVRIAGGHDDVSRGADGAFWYTGNVFTVIPSQILEKLALPVFECWAFKINHAGTALEPDVRRTDGGGSDVWFWHTVRRMDAEIVELGMARHLRHVFNERADHADPCIIGEW